MKDKKSYDHLSYDVAKASYKHLREIFSKKNSRQSTERNACQHNKGHI